jgi:hypothetical protein
MVAAASTMGMFKAPMTLLSASELLGEEDQKALAAHLAFVALHGWWAPIERSSAIATAMEGCH